MGERDVDPRVRILWRVGDLHVDPGQQEVRRGDESIPLPPLSFDVLLALVVAAPDFLSNDELMTRVWRGQVVSLETVTQRIKLLRDALGDDARQTRYIEGQRGRGYRIVAPVSREEQVLHRAVEVTGTPRRRRVGLLAGLAVGALALGALLLWRGLSPPGASPTPDVREHTVAVLPFENRSENADDAFLALGFPERLLDRLSSVQGLAVIARGSSFAVGNAAPDVRRIGTRLGAGWIIEGTVRRAGDALAIDVRLTDARRGVQIWSQHFAGTMGNLGSIERSAADALEAQLATRLKLAKPDATRADRERSLDAYLAYLRGRALLGRFSVAETLAAAPYLERAIAIDPDFAAAQAALYDARMQAASLRREDLAEARRQHAPLIERALALDPESGAVRFAHAMWGALSPAERDAAYRQALARDPSNGRGLTAFAEFLSGQGRSAEAREMLDRALRIDPVSPRAHFADAMFSLDAIGADALQTRMLQVLELDPTFVPALQRYGKYRWEHHGELAMAVRLVEQGIAQDPQNPWLRHTAVAMYLDLADVAAARDVAAGTPQSAESAKLLLGLHEGDWRAAGEAAFGSASWRYNRFENWLAGEALRDYARAGGDAGRATAFLASKFGLEPAQHLTLDNFRQAVLLSQLWESEGRVDDARALRVAVRTWNDANQDKFGTVFSRRVRASLLLLDGRTDEALDELAGAFHSQDYVHWWYTLDRDPTWAALRSSPRFRAIAAEVHRHVESEREQLEQWRRDGSVPRRPSAPR